ncbi:MAG: plasmid pRiA4b ORF-3 family protein [Actinomycetota bacterium]|nr:plasmid pRiA4b ORF-3 family protein [Actinomycetota bacterium]
MSEASHPEAILQIKVSLVGVSKPPVWRRLLVPATIRLDRLHAVIQAAMGWGDYHLHVFTAGGVDYGPPDPDPELDHVDERRTSLAEVIREPRDRMRYVYDFGDYWQHDVVVEKVLAAESGTRYPRCVTGKGRCPPEDCGGVWGYADLRETLADPAHEEHQDMLEWLGLESADDFDPAAFDTYRVHALF